MPVVAKLVTLGKTSYYWSTENISLSLYLEDSVSTYQQLLDVSELLIAFFFLFDIRLPLLQLKKIGDRLANTLTFSALLMMVPSSHRQMKGCGGKKVWLKTH